MRKHLLLAAALLIAAVGCSRSSHQPAAEATLPEVDRALQAWFMGHGSYPSDLNQLTNFPVLKGKRLPSPPPGKKLAFNPNTRQVTYVDQ